MKRFYERVNVEPADRGFAIALDGRSIRTPKKAAFNVPGQPLAEAIAEEWLRQGEDIVPDSMPFFRLANTAIDMIAPQRDAVVDNLAAYGDTDFLCYRAEDPADLVSRQHETWSPWLDWAHSHYGARLVTTNGIGHVAQDDGALASLRGAVNSHGIMELASLNDLVTISGSLVLALAISAGALDLPAAWAAVRLDNDFQAEKWGRDHEAEAHAAHLREDFEGAVQFLEICRMA